MCEQISTIKINQNKLVVISILPNNVIKSKTYPLKKIPKGNNQMQHYREMGKKLIPTKGSDADTCLVSWADLYIPLEDVWAAKKTPVVIQAQLACMAK